MFTISVCMIVKNEEKVLARCLECVKAFADEIIVVDTGSTDRTKEIAKDFTDKIFEFEWCDDFSKARNFAFSLASCDYQMWLDADDFITKENVEKIKELKESDKNADIFMCKYIFGTLSYYRERIVKRSQHFVWKGFVHEVIVPSGKIEYLDIEIEHRKIEKYDPGRNLRLYQKALKNGAKFSAREQYYYSRELFYNSKYIKAIESFKKFLRMPNNYSADVVGAYIMISDCQMAIQEFDQAITTLYDCIKYFPPNAEICCKIAYAYLSKNDEKPAIFWFKCAMQTEKQTEGFVQEDFCELIPCIELSRLLYTSDYPSAKKFHERAKEISPNNSIIQYNSKFFQEN